MFKLTGYRRFFALLFLTDEKKIGLQVPEGKSVIGPLISASVMLTVVNLLSSL